MSVLDGKTAAELADCFSDMKDFPHNTGGLSLLDEAAGRFVDLSPKLAEARRVFSSARLAHLRSYSTESRGYSDEAWAAALLAGSRLADALRESATTRSITEIVRRRYTTGEYGGTHFRMPSALWAELRETVPPPGPEPLFGGPRLDQLLAIPIVVDDELPAGTWRLVDTATKAVLFEGGTGERAA